METALVISSVLLWIVVFFNLLLTLAAVRRINRFLPEVSFLEVGSKAPDFTAERLNGEKITLATFTQRKAALVFIAPTCSSCIQKLPDWEALGPRARQNGVELVLVSLARATETKAFVEEHSIQLPVIFMPADEEVFVSNYKVMGTPQYCVIDEQGKILAEGMMGKEWDLLTQEWKT
jgi:peroxiredoxin